MTSLSPEIKERHILLLHDDQIRVIQLNTRLTTLGRDSSKDISVKCDKISREHATCLQVPGSAPGEYEYRILDGGANQKRSKNGISINGKSSYLHRLDHGDFICFSSTVQGLYLKVSLNDKDFKTYIAILKRVQDLNERTRHKIMLMTRIFDKVTSYLDGDEEIIEAPPSPEDLTPPLEPAA